MPALCSASLALQPLSSGCRGLGSTQRSCGGSPAAQQAAARLRPPLPTPPPLRRRQRCHQLPTAHLARQRQARRGAGAAAAAPAPAAGGSAAPAPAPEAADAASMQSIRLLDLFSGLSTPVCGALRAGLRVDAYAAVEAMPGVRSMAEHHLLQLQRRHGAAALPDAAIAGAHAALPQDVCAITEHHIRVLGRIDVVTAGFPCQDLSRGNQGPPLGLRGHRSGLFFQAAQVLEWVKESNPGVVWCFENVPFCDHVNPAIAEGDWRTIQRLLGVSALVFDAALVSPAHRIRAYWSNLPLSPPPRREDRDLAGALDPCHRPRLAHRSERATFPPGNAAFNVAGRPARKYPTVVRSWRPGFAHNTMNGTGFVVRRDSGREELPSVEEIERIVGLDTGATAAPDASEDQRRQACGNIWDAHVLTYIFSQARPYLPAPAAGGRPGGQPERAPLRVVLAPAEREELAREAARAVQAARPVQAATKRGQLMPRPS